MTNRRRPLLGGAILAVLLSGCIFFPPFFPPGGFVPGEGELLIQNDTDADWVVDVAGMFPMSFAVGAGQVGAVPVLADTPDVELVLRDPDGCEETDRIAWDGSGAAARIDDPGTLSVLDAAPDGEYVQFVEYWDCVEGSFVAPEPGAGLPDAGGSILLFSNEGAPFALDVGTGAINQMAPDPDQPMSISIDSYHAWSPDGTQLAFSRQEGLDRDGVYVASADGGDPVLVAEGGQIPHWSPDGTRLAYVVTDPFGRQSRLEVLELSSGEITTLASDALDASWSPDGTRLAYVTGSIDMEVESEPAEVRVVGVDGSEVGPIGETLPFGPPPSWSPDGTRLAFAAPPEGGSFRIGADSVVVVHDFTTGQTDVLAARDGQSVSEPAWSPDGDAVAVVMAGILGASGRIGLVDVATGELEELDEAAESFVAMPFWSPDGDWLAFTRTTNSGLSGSLIAIRRDGSEPTVLATRLLIATQWIPS